jgi:hypothetical protein
MQTTLFEQFKDGHEPEITRTLTIVTLFEDVATGKRGKQVFDYLGSHLGSDFEFNHQVWKLDVLATPSLRELAAKDVAEADILIISVRGDRHLAPEVKSFLDLWVGQRGTPIALVALFDPDQKHSETALTTRHYLEQMARLGQMDFFSEPEKEFVRQPVELAQERRFDFDNAFEEGILTQEVTHEKVFPRWGIND